jgi:hypothetical protein
MRPNPRYFTMDNFTKDRTSIFTSVAMTVEQTTLVTTGSDIAQLEYQDFRLLWKNEANSSFNFTPLRPPWFPGYPVGLSSAGYKFAEVEPWWFDANNQDSPPPLTAGVLVYST